MGKLTQAFKEWQSAKTEYLNLKRTKAIPEAYKVKNEKLNPAFDKMKAASITDQMDEDTFKKIYELEK